MITRLWKHLTDALFGPEGAGWRQPGASPRVGCAIQP